MNKPISYVSEFTLDKVHFNECYSQSVDDDYSIRAYFKAIVLTLFGMALVLFTEINGYAAWFVFAMGILEALSVYYQKPWWIMRQMLGKSAKGKVTLTIDDKGIFTKSHYIDHSILWETTTTLTATEKGWLITHSSGRNYISNACISVEAQHFLLTKTQS
ncbi:MAG: hypothetical protein ACI9LM_000605 [Alteromonadaceae bacterium]|jgi:hypothetical protein